MSIFSYKSRTTDVTEYIIENDQCSTESEIKPTAIIDKTLDLN